MSLSKRLKNPKMGPHFRTTSGKKERQGTDFFVQVRKEGDTDSFSLLFPSSPLYPTKLFSLRHALINQSHEG